MSPRSNLVPLPRRRRTAGGCSGSGRGLIQLGLLLLIATPVMRVALLLIGFLRQRDRTYAVVSLIVLSFLLFSLFGGRL